MTGSVVNERDVPGLQVSYRFHLTDPVRFRRSLLVSMERGHANHLADDWSATAYWYQRSPSGRIELPEVSMRRPSSSGAPDVGRPEPAVLAVLPEELRGLRERAESATSGAVAVRERDLRRRAAATRVAEASGRQEARELRSRTLGYPPRGSHSARS
jgi:hypothetical protein